MTSRVHLISGRLTFITQNVHKNLRRRRSHNVLILSCQKSIDWLSITLNLNCESNEVILNVELLIDSYCHVASAHKTTCAHHISILSILTCTSHIFLHTNISDFYFVAFNFNHTSACACTCAFFFSQQQQSE